MGIYKQQTFISHIFRGWKSEIKVPADSLSGENLIWVRRLFPAPAWGRRRRALSEISPIEVLIRSWRLHLMTASPPTNIRGTQTFRPLHTVLGTRKVFIKVFKWVRASVANSMIAFILSSNPEQSPWCQTQPLHVPALILREKFFPRDSFYLWISKGFCVLSMRLHHTQSQTSRRGDSHLPWCHWYSQSKGQHLTVEVHTWASLILNSLLFSPSMLPPFLNIEIPIWDWADIGQKDNFQVLGIDSLMGQLLGDGMGV